MRKYELVIKTYVTYQIRKNPTFQTQMPSAGVNASSQPDYRAQDLGTSAWFRDPFGRHDDEEFLQELDPRSLAVCIYLQMTCDALVLRKCDQVFAQDIKSLIQRFLAEARAQGTTLAWLLVKKAVASRLENDNAIMLLESAISMIWPDGLPASEWANSWVLTVGLLLTEGLMMMPATVSCTYFFSKSRAWSGTS